MRGVGAHDDGPVAGGRASDGGGGGNGRLSNATLAGEEHYPHGRSLRSRTPEPDEAPRHMPLRSTSPTFAQRDALGYGRGAALRFPAATISATCSCTSVSTCVRIAIVTSVLCSVRSVTPLIAVRISTFWRSALSASVAACSRVSRSFCDWRFPASSSTGPV